MAPSGIPPIDSASFRFGINDDYIVEFRHSREYRSKTWRVLVIGGPEMQELGRYEYKGNVCNAATAEFYLTKALQDERNRA